jgi:ferredoxin-type protein NapH
MFQWFRKVVQVTVVLWLIYNALQSHWRNFKLAHNSSRITGLMAGESWGEAYALNEQFLSLFGDPTTVSESVLGGPWAAEFFGVPLVDPLAWVSQVVAGHWPPLSMLLGALIPIGLGLVLGRVFCSFLCPARLFFEAGNAVRLALLRIGIPLPTVEIPTIGLWFALGLVVAAAFAGPGAFQFALPYLSINSAITLFILSGTISATAVWIGFLVVVDALYAPGQFCRSVCPTGAVLAQLSRFSLLRIARTPTPCPSGCDLCERACPYGLFAGAETHRPECDVCGACTVACPQSKLSHTMSRFAKIMVLVVLGLAPTHALAHHNKGLPHYGYFENYPQVPTKEFIDEQGRWEVGTVLFNFQGLQRRTSDTPDDVRFFAYMYDLQEHRGYKGALTLHLESDGVEIASFERLRADEEGVYVARQTVPQTGEYVLIFEFEVDGETHRVPLGVYVDIEADSVPWGMLGAAAGAVGMLFLLTLVGRRRPSARRAPAVRGPE